MLGRAVERSFMSARQAEATAEQLLYKNLFRLYKLG